jgi:hypothetical protein
MKPAGGLGDRWREVRHSNECGYEAREESPDTQWKAARPES